MVNLSKNILATICYYDCLDYPLTSFEIWKNLAEITNHELSENADNGGADESNFSLLDICKELESDKLKKFIEEFRGFYFLKGRKELVEKRLSHNKISVAKIKRLRRYVWFLRFVPFARMIGVTGRLAMKNADWKSDWDLLIVLKKGNIWTGRTLVTLVTHLLGKRRYGRKIRDRICLNYFLTDESLEIITKDLFSANEYFFMFPIFDTGIYEKFQLKNKWIKEFKPNYGLEEISNLKLIRDTLFSKIFRRLGELIFNWQILEKWLGKWQKEKIMRNPKTQQEGGLIQASSEALIFLPKPQGPEIFERFKKRINTLAGIHNS